MVVQRTSKDVLHAKRQRMLIILSKLADRDTCQVQAFITCNVHYTVLMLTTLCCRLLLLSCHSSSRYMSLSCLLPCTD